LLDALEETKAYIQFANQVGVVSEIMAVDVRDTSAMDSMLKLQNEITEFLKKLAAAMSKKTPLTHGDLDDNMLALSVKLCRLDPFHVKDYLELIDTVTRVLDLTVKSLLRTALAAMEVPEGTHTEEKSHAAFSSPVTTRHTSPSVGAVAAAAAPPGGGGGGRGGGGGSTASTERHKRDLNNRITSMSEDED